MIYKILLKKGPDNLIRCPTQQGFNVLRRSKTIIFQMQEEKQKDVLPDFSQNLLLQGLLPTKLR